MIVDSKFGNKIKQAKTKLKLIESKVDEQKSKLTTQQELALVNKEIEQFTSSQHLLRSKLEQAERDLAKEKKEVGRLEKENQAQK